MYSVHTNINFTIFTQFIQNFVLEINTDDFWWKNHFKLFESFIFVSILVPRCHKKLNRNWNSGKLIRFSSFSTQNGHCNEWIGNDLNMKHPDYVHMAPLQFAFYGQLWTTFVPKMTFPTLKIAFNIYTRVKRHAQGPWRQLCVNNMSSNVVQQNFSQLIPCGCTNSLMHVYFLLVWRLWTVLV